MTLKQLRALLAVSENGSIQAADEQLNASRPTVSQLVDSLETQQGLQLLIRSPRGTSVTAAGETLVTEAKLLLDAADALKNRFRGPFVDDHKQLRIQLPVDLPEIAHVAALEAISNKLPGTDIHVSFFDQSRIDLSEDVHLSLQFTAVPASGPFRTFLLSKVPVRLVASPDYLAEHGCPATLEELSEHRLLMWKLLEDDATRLPLLDGDWHPIRPSLLIPDAPLIRAMVARGRGIGFVPCPRPEFLPPWQTFERLLPEVVGRTACLRALIPERLSGLAVTRSLVEVTKELSLLYSAGDLVWARER